MASNFLNRKAKEQAKKIDKEYGKGLYGSTADLEKKLESPKRTSTSEKSSSTKSGGAETKNLMKSKASIFLQKKAVDFSLQNSRRGVFNFMFAHSDETEKESNTKKKYTDFNSETKNAYTTVKNNLNNTITISNGMSEDERKKRINEIDAELVTLNRKLSGYSRAKAYGGGTALAEAEKKDKERIAELSQEKKTLTRVGTFTTSELKQFEIEDAKAKVSSARQKVDSFGPRPSANVAESYRQAVSEQYNAQQEVDNLERQKELYDDITKFGDVVNEDNFGGQWRANYRSNELSREADKAISRYLDNPTEENRDIAYAYDAFAKEYAKNNEKALDDENVKASWLTKSMAGYLPQFKDQIVPELVGGGVGFIVGANAGAPTVGASVGAGLASGVQSYYVMRGSVYRTLRAEGVDEETALQAANDEALISSLIEGGETTLSWLLAGGGKAISAISGAAKASVAKGSANVATKLIANLGTKATANATTKAATKAAAEVSKPLWKKGLEIAGGVLGNGLSEYGEEAIQQGVSIANKERAMQGETGKWDLSLKTGEVIADAVTGKNPEALAEMHEAGTEGFKIGVMFGGSQATVNNIVSHYANAKTVKTQNEIADTIINDEESLDALIEEGKASGEGTVSAKIAEEVEQARENGNVTREQVKKLIASNEVYIKEEEQTNAPDTLEQAAMDVVAERNRKSTPLYERLEAQSRNNEPITVADAKNVTGFGDRGAELVAKTANVEGATFYETVAEVKPSYLAGFNNPDMDIKKVAHTFTSQAQQDAYTAGQQDAIMQNSFAKEKSKSATVYDGVFTENEYTKNWSEATKKMVSTVAKHFGMDISAVDRIIANKYTGAEANASHTDGKLEISNNKDATKLIHALIMHESGHRMEQFATDEWNELASFLYERAERLGRRVELGVSQGMLFDDVKAQHDEAGISLSTKGYIGEIAVRELETIFGSAEEFNSFVSEIESNQQVKTAWGKFVQWLSELIDDLKRAWSQRKMTAEEKAEARKVLAEMERIKELYAKAYLATKDAVAERKSEAQSASAQKNTDTKGGADFSLKTFDGKRIVWIEESGLTNKQLNNHQAVAEYIAQHIGEVYTIIESGQKVFIGEDLPQEYTQSKYTTYLRGVNQTAARGKNKAVDGFGELIETATNRRWEKTKHTHNKDAKYGMYRYDNSFAFPVKDNKGNVTNVRAFDVELLIRNASDGNKYLYDIVEIKENTTTEIGLLERVTRMPDKSQATRDSVSNDKIPQNPKSVKRDFSLKAPTFYSHMGKTIDEMKQDKIGANSVVSYLKGRGVKDEEIKWSGIETFLEGKKSVTKAELQEFVAGSMLQIETKTLTEKPTIDYTEDESNSLDGLSELYNEYWGKIDKLWMDKYGEEIAWDIRFNDNAEDALRLEMRKLQREDAGSSDFFDEIYKILGNIRTVKHNEDAIIRRATERTNTKKGNLKTKYEQYTLDGGNNYRELLFKLPNSEYTNDSMSYHWGEEGILAHARIQDFDIDGDKMLFIEELQSDWHNEGAKKGYADQNKAKLVEQYEALKKKNSTEFRSLVDNLTEHYEGRVDDPAEAARTFVVFAGKDSKFFDLAVKKYDIPTELADRAIAYEKAKVEEARLFNKALSADKGVPDAPFRNNYHEYVLKSLIRTAAEEGYDSIGWTTADIQSKRWSEDYAEGYRIEYDQDIPKFLNKYGKKWGAKVGTSNINGNEVWSMPITDSMKDSVLYEGQPMFSLKKPVEETKNLIAVHNMQSSELERTLDLGGLPMPSIAIIKAQSGHSEYGDVSLVFDKSVIDPKANKNNKVYGGDAWTPTYPTIEYKPNDKIADKISDKYYELSRKYGNDESRPLYDYVYDLERRLNTNKGEAGMISELYEDTNMMQLYLLDSGKEKVETIKKETRTELTDAEVEMNEFFIKELGADVVDEVKWDGNGTPFAYRKNYMSKYEDAIRETYKKLLSEVYQFSEEQVQNVLDSTKPADFVKFVRDAYTYRQNGRVTIKTEDDYSATQQAIKDAAGEDYRKWVDSLFKGVEEKSGIRNNVDYFTNSGNRRSWEALHWENNLENVIKIMKGQDDVGSVGFFSGQNIWGVAAKDYRSIEEIKADSDRLQQIPEEEYNKIKEGFGQRLSEIAHSIMDKSERNPFIASDNAMECIVDAVRNSKTKSGILSRLKQYPQLTVTQTTVDDIVSLVSDIANMPTEYFEAKPKRAVELNEIATAIIPDNTGQTTKARLDDMGIKYVEYESGNENARLEALNSLEDVKFSLKGTNDISTKDRAELLDIIEHLKGEFEITKFAKADPKKLAKMTKALLKEYNSLVGYDETFNAIDNLYQYMANGEEGHPAVWEDVYNRAYDVAREIVKNALVVDDAMYREYESLRNYLRTTPMKFYAGYDDVPSAYENFNDFRKHNMGRLKFTNNGMSIDSVYQELAGLYPEFFDTDRDITTSAQLDTIVNVLDSLRATDVNPFDGQVEQASMYLANDIISRFFDIPQAKPTFADKAERRVTEAHIKGAKKVEAVRQQKDAKIKKLIEAQKEKTKKQLDKLREQRDTKVKKEQEKRRAAIAKMGESQRAKVLRAQIMRHASDLSKKLVNPTDNQHIPQELQGVVAKLLECINLESNYTYDPESHSYKKNDMGLATRRTQAFNELKNVYADIASSVVVDPDLIVEGGLLSDVISLADKRIADMTSSELEKVWQTIRAIEASVSTANKMFSQGKFETILEFAEALRKDNASKKEKTELKGVLGKGKKLATLDMLTPETYLHQLGSAGDSIFRMMRDAQDKHISIMKEVADFTRKTLNGVDVNSLEETMHTVKLGGENVQLSTAQLMELYVLMKREQAVDHILVGGILPDITKSKGVKLNTKAEPIRSLSMSEISAALSKLTDEQKKIADKLQRYVSTVLSAYGNEASMKVYNYEKFLEKNYWTIRTNKQEIVSEIGKDTAVTSVANKGMAKGTKPHANTSVRIGSIFDTFSAHSSDMATYAAWLGTSEDVNRIRNFVFWDDGARTGTVKGILDTVHGIHGSEYLQKLLTDIAIGVKGTDNMNPFDKFIGSYKAASVGANLRVVIQQPTAILRALDMIDAHYLAEGALRPLKGWEKAKKYAPIAQWKDWGHFDINTGRQMKDVLFDNASLLEKTKQVGMWGASKADSISWGLLWNAVEAETKAKHKGLEVGSDAYYETVSKRFTEIVDHTQVVDGILQRSQIMRSPDALTKMATSFMGEPTKQYNMAVAAAYDAINSKGAAQKKALARLGRTATSLAVAGIINACAQSIIDAMRDDDKEKDYWEKWLAALIGDGEETKWYNSNLADTFNPLTYVPFAKDVMSIVQGYDVKRMDAEAITKTLNAVTNMYKAVTGTGKYTIAEASAQLFAEICRLYGLPVANVKRDVKSLVMSVAIETDNYLMQYRMEKAMLDINYAGNSKNFMDILFNAYSNDREAYEYIYNDMLKSGYKADSIQSGMETRMMKAEGVTKASDLSKRYMTPNNEKKYDKSFSKIKSSKVWKSANATQKKNAKADLYSFLISDSEDMAKTRAEAKDFGVDETEYTLWQLAIEMADQPKGQKGSGSYDYKEKAEALNSLNFGDKEVAYFFGKGLTESGKKELDEVMDAGIDVIDYVNFKAATSDMKADKDANGKSISGSKKRKVVNYLDNANLSDEEYRYFYREIMNYK